MDDVDKILVKSYEAKFLKYSNSALFPLYSGVLIFTGAIVVFLLNQTASSTPIFPIAIILALILLYSAIAALTLYFKAKYEEYSKKFKTIIIKEVAANSLNTSFEELVKEITDKTFFNKEDVETILFRLILPVVQTGTIAGTVTNASSGAPIAGATVTAGSMNATTNFNGVYSISIARGTYTVTASATGFVSSIASVTVTAGATVTHNFALT